jgi:HlyD family secretion protein
MPTKMVSNPSNSAALSMSNGASSLRIALRSRRVVSLTLALAAVAVSATVAWRWPVWEAVQAADVPPAAGAHPLARHDFVRYVRLTGITEATRSYIVTTPLLAGSNSGNLVVTRLAEAGSQVRAGDVVVEFDRQAQEKLAFDKKAEYDDLVQQISQKHAEQTAATVKDESELAQAEDGVKSAELETLRNEMLSRIKAEKNTQDLDEARAKLAALKDGFGLKRAAAAADLRILEIKRDRAKAVMDHAAENARSMTIRSPIDGLVVPKLTWRGNGPADIQEGDELWPGAAVLQVVNPASMQVRARVNQADLAGLAAGLPVVVHLDAYPDLTMTGRIAQVAPIGVPGSFSPRVRLFTAVIAIDGSNPRLLPDLTAAIDVEVGRVANALTVPRAAVRHDGPDSFVRVRDGSGVREKRVTLGAADEVSVVVNSGLEPGDVVLQ